MKKKVVILTTHFGTNFSGGSTATCEIISRLEGQFESVTVVGTDLGKHPFKKINFIKYRNWLHAIKLLKRLNNESTLFYGDFYNSVLFVLAGVKFYFTYHDNWPELGKTSNVNFLRSLFYTSIYHKIFEKAAHVFVVSNHKLKYVRVYNQYVTLVRNGFDIGSSEGRRMEGHVLMVGNIDKRKYEKALMLFEELKGDFPDFKIDIYGKINDDKLSLSLKKHPFVSIKGFYDQVPYGQYSLLLHTSIMENLPIVFCEALHHKTPILAFDVGGSNEIVNTSNGVLIPCYNIDLMKEALCEVLNNEKPFRLDGSLPNEYSWNVASKVYSNKLAC